MRKAYFFSGLGADERVFGFLKLEIDQKRCIKWVLPKIGEGLTDYAKRIVEEQFDKNENEPVVLIGVSFGGIVATEVSKLVKTEKLILISSIKTRHEIPLIYQIAGHLKLHVLMPAANLKSANFLTYRMFGLKEKAHKQLLKTILKETDSRFLKWAMNEIVNWRNEIVPENTVHIHGTRDWILPFRCVKNVVAVLGGGHLMVITHSSELTEIINITLKIVKKCAVKSSSPK